ncbi:U-box domain-containing protein 28 [Cajanus cajan]|uniref:U-box domain-containing protein n=1 Tax=Cajanus cajan TaxID=3821 RepID=A0A151SQ60_CAJCA|nr:U-box domain-containing protein 28 [Cajanus cajan]KYP56879.1 U-box domain-containing protein 28 [Cajanus cajan]
MAKVRDKLYVTVPSLFRCPISMDVMRSPVSLCTGVTYDRTSIQRWLDLGHDTCPATMQVLPSKDFIPNLTLHRLIRLWLLSAEPPSPEPRPSADHLRALLRAIDQDLAGALAKIAEFAKSSADNRRLLAACTGFDSAVVRALAVSAARTDASENAIYLLDSVLREHGNSERIRKLILDAREQCFDSMASVLKNGSPKSKVETVRVLEFLARSDFQAKKSVAETRGFFSLLASFLKDEGKEELNDAVLSLLGVVSVTHSAKVELVNCGVVAAVSELLRACSAATAERCLRVLAVAATCAEGRAAMAAEEHCAAAVVERVARAPKGAAEDAVAVLWSLCCLCGSAKVRDDVAKRNGVAVILLVMQRGWGEHVRSMCVDLIKVLKGACKNGLGLGLELGCYDTKTTHIKPC